MSRLTDHSHIEIDRAGWGSYLRLTCMVDGNTLLQKRWWDQGDWDKESDRFILKHKACNNNMIAGGAR